MALFAVAVFVSFVYLISQGALDWDAPLGPTRPGVRRVGLEGREYEPVGTGTEH
jgi:hypothetical protein